MTSAAKSLNLLRYDILILLGLYLINPMGIDYLIGYALVPLILLKKNFLLQVLDNELLFLTFFSVSYAIFYSFNPVSGLQFVAIYALFPPVFYLTGKYLPTLFPQSNSLYKLFFILGILLSVTSLASVMTKLLEGGFGIFDRNLPNIWTGEIIPATIMGSFFTINMCIPALLIQTKNKNGFWFNLTGIVIFILSLLCVLRIGVRTQLLICFLTFGLALFYVIPQQSFSRNVFLLLLFLSLGVYLTRNISFSWNADWMAAFTDRMDGSGEDVMSGGGRTDRWMKSIKNLIKKPLGWDVEEFGYAHNLWLDVLRVAGVIPFFTLLAFTINSFIKAIKASKIIPESLGFKLQIRVYILALFLIFMVEPIFEGMYSLFLFFCLFVGAYNKMQSDGLGLQHSQTISENPPVL